MLVADLETEETGNELEASIPGRENLGAPINRPPFASYHSPASSLIMERTVSVRGYINSYLVPFARSVRCSTLLLSFPPSPLPSLATLDLTSLWVSLYMGIFGDQAIQKGIESREFCEVYQMMNVLYPGRMIEYDELFNMNLMVSKSLRNLRMLSQQIAQVVSRETNPAHTTTLVHNNNSSE